LYVRSYIRVYFTFKYVALESPNAGVTGLNRVNFSVLPCKEMTMAKKVKLSLCLINRYDMQTYGGVDAQLHVFLTSALDRGDWLASRPGRFTPEDE
jgi:hypothetical protein